MVPLLPRELYPPYSTFAMSNFLSISDSILSAGSLVLDSDFNLRILILFASLSYCYNRPVLIRLSIMLMRSSAFFIISFTFYLLSAGLSMLTLMSCSSFFYFSYACFIECMVAYLSRWEDLASLSNYSMTDLFFSKFWIFQLKY